MVNVGVGRLHWAGPNRLLRKRVPQVTSVREAGLLSFGNVQTRFGALQRVFGAREVNLRIVALQ